MRLTDVADQYPDWAWLGAGLACIIPPLTPVGMFAAGWMVVGGIRAVEEEEEANDE